MSSPSASSSGREHERGSGSQKQSSSSGSPSVSPRAPHRELTAVPTSARNATLSEGSSASAPVQHRERRQAKSTAQPGVQGSPRWQMSGSIRDRNIDATVGRAMLPPPSPSSLDPRSASRGQARKHSDRTTPEPEAGSSTSFVPPDAQYGRKRRKAAVHNNIAAVMQTPRAIEQSEDSSSRAPESTEIEEIDRRKSDTSLLWYQDWLAEGCARDDPFWSDNNAPGRHKWGSI